MTNSRHKLASIPIALAIIATLALAAIPQQQARAASTTLTSAATNQDLAKSIATRQYSTAPIAVLAENASGSVHIATNFSSRRRLPLLVSINGSTPSDVLPQLKAWNTKQVYLIGASGYFTAAYTAALSANGITVTSSFQSSDNFERWRLAAEPNNTGEYVLARSDNVTAYRIATTYAASKGAKLLIWSASTSPTRLKDFFAQVEGATIVIFAGPDVAPTDQMSEVQARNVLVVDPADPRRAQIWATSRIQAWGGTTNDIVVAPVDSIVDIGLAGVRARDRNALALVAGTKAALTTGSRAHEILSLWKGGTSTVELVGVGVTSTHLTTVSAPTDTPAVAAPGFRITGLSLNSDKTYRLLYTTVGGASTYVAYDSAGVVLAQSSSYAMIFPTQPAAVLISAKSASGATLRSINVTTNSYQEAGNRDSVMLAQVAGGTAHLRLLSEIKTPRLITRRTVDTFGELAEEVPVAITCSTAFTEGGLDPSTEYRYSVSDFTSVSVRACDSSLPAQPSTGRLNLSAASLPPTAMSTSTGRVGRVDRAAPTYFQRKIVAAKERNRRKANSRSDKTADWNTWPDLLFRWRAYIPERRVPIFFSKNLFRPVYAVAGDNTGSGPNNSSRFTQTATVDFGDDYATRYSETMSRSYGFECTSLSLNDCVQVQDEVAPLSQLNYRVESQLRTLLGSSSTPTQLSL